MMLRPATPLTILFLAAFILLLLTTISTPLVKGIPIAKYGGYDFGVWGYCKGAKCSSLRLGYSTDGLFEGSNANGNFNLPGGTRKSISTILVIHPVAAFLTLVCTGLAFASHFHAPSHSPRFLLGLFILTIPTLACTLLALLVDLLVFSPNVVWGGWLGVGATCAVAMATIVTCFMRRTLVSRKARRKRIAENAEMNGQTYFETRQAEIVAGANAYPKAESPPPLSGSSVSPGYEKAATVSTYDVSSRQGSDERVPLNSMIRYQQGPNGYDNLQGPPRRDQYGNPLVPDMMGGTLRNVPSNPSVRSGMSNHSGSQSGYGPGRGRGGYGPPRGGYGPGRGGYGPPRGGGMMMRGGPGGMRGPAPYGYNGPHRGRGMGGPPPGGMGRGGMGPNYPTRFYDGRSDYNGSAPSLVDGRGPEFDRSLPPAMDGADRYNTSDIPQQPLPPLDTRGPVDQQGPIGQAVEMDERNGLPSPSSPDRQIAERGGLGVNGPIDPIRHRQDLMSPSSDYSAARSPDTYVPPRQQWAQKAYVPPVINNRVLSPIQGSPVSSTRTPPRANLRTSRTSSDAYVEDVDPQFAAPTSAPNTTQPSRPHFSPATATASGVALAGIVSNSGPPRSHHGSPRMGYNDMPPQPNHAIAKQSPTLTKFLSPSDPNLVSYHPNGSDLRLQPSNSSESLPDGQRSPAESEGSHFTSVSQRGVNPNWRPAPGYGPNGGYGRGPPSSRRPNADDVLLNSNPDFSLPGMGPPGRGGRPRSGSRGAMNGGIVGPPGGGRSGGSGTGGGGGSGGMMNGRMMGPSSSGPSSHGHGGYGVQHTTHMIPGVGGPNTGRYPGPM